MNTTPTVFSEYFDPPNPTVAEARQIVRLTTSCWRDDKGCYIKRSLVTLRRKSVGYQLLEEECSNTSAEEAIQIIVNLAECKDGVYEVRPCNECKDWETGIVDSYDLELVPYAV